MLRVRWVIGACCVWLSTSCGGNNDAKYAQAAIGTGAVIAASGLNRAVTKDCWGTCSTGYACNETSGLCERGECLPGCEVGTHCVRDSRDITYCARDSKPAPPPKASVVAPSAGEPAAVEPASGLAPPPEPPPR